MEQWALRVIEKKNKRLAELKAKGKESEDDLDKVQLTQEQIDEINRKEFGFPYPPSQVSAVGRSGSAAIWWTFNCNLDEIVGWEITRYRRDKKEWRDKGTISLKKIPNNQYVLQSLSNGFQYCFTVRARNSRGISAESEKSNPVMVEPPLPIGWFRFYHPEKDKFYYANLKTRQSSWERPELDPDFLGEDIIFNFNKEEIKNLRELYDEEMYHFDMVTVDRFMVILRECGEIVSMKKILVLLKGFQAEFGKKMTDKELEQISHGITLKNADTVQSWQHFMAIVNQIKREKINSANFLKLPPGVFNFYGRQILKFLKGNDMDRKKFGPWKLEYSDIAQREIYVNIETKQTCWEMPEEVRFYLPPLMEEKLMVVFDFGHIENFKRQFTEIDVDCSGSISDKEMRLLLTAMGLNVTDAVFKNLMNTIDLNGNGIIEFDEVKT